MHCPNCDCPADLAILYCDGCDEVLCYLCWKGHNADWPDHTEHVAVMTDRGMTSLEIRSDLEWHITTATPTPDYHAV